MSREYEHTPNRSLYNLLICNLKLKLLYLNYDVFVILNDVMEILAEKSEIWKFEEKKKRRRTRY